MSSGQLSDQGIEKEIFKRFNELKGGAIVVESIDDSNFELKQILEFFGEPSLGRQLRLLDVGCGKGKFCRKLKDMGFNVIGVEPSEGLIEIARQNNKDLDFIQSSATHLPFKDNSLDCLICIEVLEHIPDTKQAIKEMVRVLKPKGKILIIDKNILSLHYKYLIPTFLWKIYLESTNKWFYPKEFPFREKYFIPWRLSKLIKYFCSYTEIKFIHYVFEYHNCPFMKKVLWKTHNRVSSILGKICPFFEFYVAWRGIK